MIQETRAPTLTMPPAATPGATVVTMLVIVAALELGGLVLGGSGPLPWLWDAAALVVLAVPGVVLLLRRPVGGSGSTGRAICRDPQRFVGRGVGAPRGARPVRRLLCP